MTGFLNNLRSRINQRGIVVQLIAINVFIFLVLAVVKLIATLFVIEGIDYASFIEVSPDTHVLASRPWTVFTYMFVHYNVFHIFFNMVVLYWAGQLFLSYFNSKTLGSLYILGGLTGAALFILAFNTIPYFVAQHYPPMIGASGAVTAILFAAAFYNPQRQINLLLLGSVKIIYVAAFIFVLDFISLGGTNAGGHVAHIGGAIIGYVYAKAYLGGKDITRWITRIIDSVANLFKPRPKKKMKVKVKNSREADYNYNQRRHNEQENVDRILDKIKASGYNSLTAEEKKRLFDASQK